MSVSGNSNYTWAGSTTNVRAMQKPGASDRLAACWHSSSSFTVDLNLTGGVHHVSAYFLDWDNRGRVQRVEVLDAATGAVLDTRTVSGFSGGQYLSWDLSGHVQIRITKLSGTNAVLSGLLFGEAGGSVYLAPDAGTAQSNTLANVPESRTQPDQGLGGGTRLTPQSVVSATSAKGYLFEPVAGRSADAPGGESRDVTNNIFPDIACGCQFCRGGR
jgi:hypothetical protein